MSRIAAVNVLIVENQDRRIRREREMAARPPSEYVPGLTDPKRFPWQAIGPNLEPMPDHAA